MQLAPATAAQDDSTIHQRHHDGDEDDDEDGDDGGDEDV